jgi:hypothetical protein
MSHSKMNGYPSPKFPGLFSDIICTETPGVKTVFCERVGYRAKGARSPTARLLELKTHS